MDLITRRVIKEIEQEGREIDLKNYVNPDTPGIRGDGRTDLQTAEVHHIAVSEIG